MTNFSAIETDLDSLSSYSVQLNRWFLKPIGAWPFFPTTTKFERIVSFILIVVCYSLLISTVIPCVLHLILEENDFVVRMKLVGPVGHWFVGSINYTALLLRGKDIRYCVEHMKADWRLITRVKEQQVMLKNAKFGRYVAVFCAVFMQSGVLCFCILTAFSTELIQVGNDTISVHQIPCPVYTKLIDVNVSPINEIILVVQCLSGFIVNSSTIGIFGIEAVLCAHACGQLSVVMLRITEFVNEPKALLKVAPLKQMGIIVEQHMRALRYVSCNLFVTYLASHLYDRVTFPLQLHFLYREYDESDMFLGIIQMYYSHMYHKLLYYNGIRVTSKSILFYLKFLVRHKISVPCLLV